MAKRKHLQGGILSMERVREVLRLHEQGYNQRVISRATGVARSSLQAYLRQAEVEGITYEQALLLSDSELRAALKSNARGETALR